VNIKIKNFVKNIKKILSLWIILAILWNIAVFAWKSEENILKCSWKKWFELYTCEKKEICNKENFWQIQWKKIVSLNQTYKKDTSFSSAKSIYRNNQNLIYKCAILNSQEKAIRELNEKLVNYTDKTGILKTRIIPKINKKLAKINQLLSANKCKVIGPNSWTKQVLKKITLDQSTLEYCNYRYFLKYLNELEEKNWAEKNFPKNAKSIPATKLKEIISENKNTILNEINHTDDLYPIAYQTYAQYDSFIKIHIILELLKEDYRVLRDKLYQVLHPINQVVYKIINAQSK